MNVTVFDLATQRDQRSDQVPEGFPDLLTQRLFFFSFVRQGAGEEVVPSSLLEIFVEASLVIPHSAAFLGLVALVHVDTRIIIATAYTKLP